MKISARLSACVCVAASVWFGVADGQVPAPAAAASAVVTARAAPLPLDVFFGPPKLWEAVLSPSGDKLAYTVLEENQRVGLYIYDLTANIRISRVIQYTDVDIVNISWVNEKRLIYSMAKGSGSRTPPGLYAINIDGTGARELIQRYQSVVSDSLPTALSWNHVVLKVPIPVVGRVNEEILVGVQSFSSVKDVPIVHPVWLNVVTGKTHATNFDAPRRSVDWVFDDFGEPRISVALENGAPRYFWRAPNQTAWRALDPLGVQSTPFVPHSVDDKGNLFVTRIYGKDGERALFKYDFNKNAPSDEPLVNSVGFDFRGRLINEPGMSNALGVRVVTDVESTVWFDSTIKAVQARVDAKFVGRVNRISCRRCMQANAVFLVRTYSDRLPGELWLYRPHPQDGLMEWTPFSRVRPEVDPKSMANMEFQRIKARDGRDLPVWFTLPQGSVPGKPMPAVLLVHGGPWVRGAEWEWHGLQQFLASRGYLVIEPEYRGSTGYGDAHFKAGWKQWGTGIQDDIVDALLWAQQQGLASDKACIVGSSFGGYSTLMGLATHPDLYQCGVAVSAVSDLKLMLEGSWWNEDDISDDTRKYSMPEMVADLAKDADLIAASSPILLVKKITKPLFLVHGKEDLRVPLVHAERMRDALKREGREPEWIFYGSEGHSWRRYSTDIDFAQRLENFLAKHLQN